ncbi:DUF6228 family protein [Streptomyces sp. NPDC087270]|uniref:DUF6228 family protein n=1 Tax=Streptomyces sp. NPDC087270 TaxID=3365774 RepID=UPI0038139942
MASPDSDTDDKPGVTFHCQDNPAVGVKFCDRFSFDEDSVHYAVELWAPGRAARVNEVAAWNRDSDLVPFLEELARDHRGWNGERAWPKATGGWTASGTTWFALSSSPSRPPTDGSSTARAMTFDPGAGAT